MATCPRASCREASSPSTSPPPWASPCSRATACRWTGRPASTPTLGWDPDRRRSSQHPSLAIAANGGSDLIYLFGPKPQALAAAVVKALMAQDYTGGIFVNGAIGAIPGTLPLGAAGAQGLGPDARAEHRRRIPQLSRPGAPIPRSAQRRWRTPSTSRARASTAASAGRTRTTSWRPSARTSKRGFMDPAPGLQRRLGADASQPPRPPGRGAEAP